MNNSQRVALSLLLLCHISIFFFGSCSENAKQNSYCIEEKVIDNKVYFIIDSKEDLIWLSREDCFRLTPMGHISDFFRKEGKADLGMKWKANYIQTCDIDFTPSETAGSDTSQSSLYDCLPNPIGTDVPFTGSYNAQGHTITHIALKKPTNDTIGVFGYVVGGRIENLTIKDCYIVGRSAVGALAGYMENSVVKDIHVSGDLTITGVCAGGIVGLFYGSRIVNSSFNGSVIGNSASDDLGGISGMSYLSIIRDCKSSGTLFGNSELGGISGSLHGDSEQGLSINKITVGTIINCYSDMSQKGDMQVGGIAGDIIIGSFIGCLFTGDIVANKYVGGIGGECQNTLLDMCGNMGQIKCEAGGGLVGEISPMWAEIENGIYRCYNYGTVIGGRQSGGIAAESYEVYMSDLYSDGLVSGDGKTAGIVGFARPSTCINNMYTTGKVIGKKESAAIVSELYGTRVTSREDVELMQNLQDALGEKLKGTGIKVRERKEGEVVFSGLRNSFWCKETSGQTKSVFKINYNEGGTQSSMVSYNRLKGSNYLSDFWTSSFSNTKFLPFLSWQPVVIQYTKSSTSNEVVVCNNKNSNLINRIGFLIGDDSFFDFETDTKVEVDTLNVGMGQLASFNIEDKDISIKGKYIRPFAVDTDNKVWYGGCRFVE